jgi:hypothetical protein
MGKNFGSIARQERSRILHRASMVELRAVRVTWMRPLFISTNERGQVRRSMSRTVMVGSLGKVVPEMEGGGNEWLRAAATAAATMRARALVEVASLVLELASKRLHEEGGVGKVQRSLV